MAKMTYKEAFEAWNHGEGESLSKLSIKTGRHRPTLTNALKDMEIEYLKNELQSEKKQTSALLKVLAEAKGE